MELDTEHDGGAHGDLRALFQSAVEQQGELSPALVIPLLVAVAGVGVIVQWLASLNFAKALHEGAGADDGGAGGVLGGDLADHVGLRWVGLFR